MSDKNIVDLRECAQRRRRNPMDTLDEATVVDLREHQKSAWRDAVCRDCGYREDMLLPVTMPADAVECPGCFQTKFIVFQG